MELMIVIVIIGILSGVGMVMFGDQAEKAKIAATEANFRNVQKFLAVEFFKCQIDRNEIILDYVDQSNKDEVANTDTAFVADGVSITNQQHLDNGYANGSFKNQ